MSPTATGARFPTPAPRIWLCSGLANVTMSAATGADLFPKKSLLPEFPEKKSGSYPAAPREPLPGAFQCLFFFLFLYSVFITSSTQTPRELSKETPYPPGGDGWAFGGGFPPFSHVHAHIVGLVFFLAMFP